MYNLTLGTDLFSYEVINCVNVPIMSSRANTRSLASLLAGCLICSSLIAAESYPVIELHAQVRIENMAVNDDSEITTGPSESTQLIMALLEEAGFEYEFNLSPWTRIYQLLESRPNVLSYPVARIPAREDTVFWIGMMRPIRLSLYGLRENSDRLPTTLDAARAFQDWCIAR